MSNEMQTAIENTRIIRDAIEAANFRRHECEVSECGGRLCMSVKGIEDDTATHGTTVSELWRLCRVVGLAYEDHRGQYQHGGSFACTGVDGLSLADVVARMTAGEINTNSEAYNTGFAAAEAGEDRTACPYAAGTWDANNWLAGWDAA